MEEIGGFRIRQNQMRTNLAPTKLAEFGEQIESLVKDLHF
jgi:hypothetical protein